MIFEDFQLQLTMWFENNHNAFFDAIFTVFTELGDVTFLLFVFMFIYWNISKQVGLKIAFGIALSFGINTGIKESFKNIRPFYRDGITKGLSKEVTGYSFPSGHAQNTGALWTILIYEGKNLWLTVIGIMMMIMIPLSRLYLRVHWLQDVVIGLALGIIIAIIYETFLAKWVYKFLTHPLVITFMTPLSFFLVVWANDSDVAKGLGVFAGVLYGYWLEARYVNYQIEGSIRAKAIRFGCGAAGLIILQILLKKIFLDQIYMDYMRYYILGIYITFIAPYLFNKIKTRKE